MPEVFISKEMIEASINNTLQKELDKAVENLKRTLPKIQLEIRKESFQSFKLVTGIIIEQEFVKVYGHSFDLSSLQHSLIYIQSKDTLDVKIDYNSNVFRFNDSYFNEQNKFNQNAFNTKRLVETEVARCQNQANEYFAKEHGVEKQMFVATLDDRTTEFCQDHDGIIYGINDSNKPTLPAHPLCRSCYINIIDDWDFNTRKDNRTGEYIDFMSYEEWKKENNVN